MMDLSALSKRYYIRRMDDSDADSILELCKGNAQYYLYCQAEPSKEQILSDLHITPPGIDPSDKYYIRL